MGAQTLGSLWPRQDSDADSLAAVCDAEPTDLSNMPLRIGSIFIVFSASILAATLPLAVSRRMPAHPVSESIMFFLRYIGTGVIISTAFMHLLSPAIEALHDDCLADRFGGYDFATAIPLIAFLAMLTVHFAVGRITKATLERRRRRRRVSMEEEGEGGRKEKAAKGLDLGESGAPMTAEATVDGEDGDDSVDAAVPASRIVISTLILEFGVLFHSIFIGLSLAVTDELHVLIPVLAVHQFLEGVALGQRLAEAPWPRRLRRWLPLVFALAFALSTPVATAVGLRARPDSVATSLLVQGVFDALSAGILFYTGAELILGAFGGEGDLEREPISRQTLALACVLVGAALMMVLAKWA